MNILGVYLAVPVTPQAVPAAELTKFLIGGALGSSRKRSSR